MPGTLSRPAAHFLDLDQIQHVADTAWDLAQIDRPTFGNALRANVQISTGLRVAELHALQRADIDPKGWLNVRCGKGNKPRRAPFLDGGPDSPTLATLLEWCEGKNRPRGRSVREGETIWTSGPHAYSHWVAHRLGPASGLQREIGRIPPKPSFVGPLRAPPPRYLIRTHLFRACFVIIARRLPKRHGREPIEWPTIARWMGHSTPAMTQGRYWYADEDEDMAELVAALPVGTIPRREIEPQFNTARVWRTR